MNDRWKYQLKMGLFWGIFMNFFMILMDDKTLIEQVYSIDFYIRVLVYIAVGVFFMGYITWKEKNGKLFTWSS